MMSSNPQKVHRKRPADSEDIDVGERDHRTPEDFKIKTLDEILQEKRRRIEKDDAPGEERNGSPEGNSSPVTSARRESRTSSKQGSPSSAQGPGGEIIYQLSPEQLSLSPPSSTSGTPKKLKPQLSHEVVPASVRVKKGRKTTEEEEGEIVSDPSDSENRRGEKRSRRYSSISNPDVEEKISPVEPKEEAAMVTKKSEESSEEEDTNEEESEDDTETATATKRVRIEAKETTDVKQEESASESESGSEESSSEDDDDDDDDDDEEEVVQKESKSKMKQQKETEVKASGSKELRAKNKDEEEEGESSSEEESSEEDSEEEESESDSSEESEHEEVKKSVSEKTEQVFESTKVEEFESEDLHKELQQLKHRRSTDERHRQKVRAERHHHQERVDRRRGESFLSVRGDKDRKTSDKEKGHSKYLNLEERRHSESKSKSRSYERGKSADVHVHVDSKQKDSRDRHKSYGRESSKTKSDRPGTREKHSEMEVDREKKSLRKDSEKHQKSSPDETAKLETKRKDQKDRGGSRRKSTTSGKGAKDSRDGGEDPLANKSRKDEGKSLILTARERRQFTNEVVDIESEGSSAEDDIKEEAHSDFEMKQLSDGEQEEDEKEKKAKLPAYYPAVRGCRNVEEFQWLNRIEEGTYGVVYRAKDKRTGDIVALKKLKMEREKEGFPITSLREINTLLKAQHPNIVTVREIVVGSNMDKIYIVMDYVEHDLKVLMEHMTQGFRIGEIKTLMIQLLRAVTHLHDNWILHRDLKASNLLLSNKGILKVGDFGLAREYGSPLKNYTPIVVTLWYRAPELLLGTKEYSTPIDLWSVGCILAELLTMKPLFPGKSEIDQINRIFKDLGTPSDKIWPGPPSYSELPAVKKMTFTDYPYNNLRNKFGAHLTDKGFDLLNRFLTYDPNRRITAEKALEHEYFSESPQPVDPSMFPTWPAKSEMAKRPKKKDVEHSPQAPEGGAMFAKLADEGDSGNGSQGFRMPTSKKGSAAVVGFTLKF